MTGASRRLRYVALGDSYTIGTSVDESERWPDQLVARISELHLVANLAVNGFTTRDVIERELPELPRLRPELVTLLIGVNDVVQGFSEEAYRANLAEILDDVTMRVGPSRVLVVSTPDYTVTPAGADYGDPAAQSARIQAFNAVERLVAEERGIGWVDVYDLSLAAADDGSLVAHDGLHPSGVQYRRWVDRIEPRIRELIRG